MKEQKDKKNKLNKKTATGKKAVDKREKLDILDLDESLDTENSERTSNGQSRRVRLVRFVRTNQKKLIQSIRKQKEERLTVMFIPHNEKSIRNFHISNLTLNIVLAISGIVIFISAVLIIRHNSTVQEVDKLKISQKDAQVQFARVRQEIREIGNSYANFRKHVSELSGLSKGQSMPDDSLFAAGGVTLPEDLDLSQEQTSIANAETIPIEMFLLNRIIHEMEVSLGPLENMKDYLKKREKIIRNSPTLWPVRGYILNPFGYVRSGDRLKAVFNRGIDIATFPGAVVAATAPGVVVSIQRDARFIYTVRVRHNYGFETVYEGLERINVARNEKIGKGEKLGYVGQFRDSPENILHYEIHIGVEPVDPMPYLSVLKN